MEWRSNLEHLRELRPDLKTVIFRIPLSHGWPGLNLSNVDGHEDADHYIKMLKNVELRRSDVQNLEEITRVILELGSGAGMDRSQANRAAGQEQG